MTKYKYDGCVYDTYEEACNACNDDLQIEDIIEVMEGYSGSYTELCYQFMGGFWLHVCAEAEENRADKYIEEIDEDEESD